jgi:hypothetical protein
MSDKKFKDDIEIRYPIIVQEIYVRTLAHSEQITCEGMKLIFFRLIVIM